jgi:hypothetical protein
MIKDKQKRLSPIATHLQLCPSQRERPRWPISSPNRQPRVTAFGSHSNRNTPGLEPILTRCSINTHAPSDRHKFDLLRTSSHFISNSEMARLEMNLTSVESTRIPVLIAKKLRFVLLTFCAPDVLRWAILATDRAIFWGNIRVSAPKRFPIWHSLSVVQKSTDLAKRTHSRFRRLNGQ